MDFSKLAAFASVWQWLSGVQIIAITLISVFREEDETQIRA